MTDAITAIDKAIAAAQARKAAKSGLNTLNTGELNDKKHRLSDVEKAARNEERESHRAEKQAQREAARAEKRALRESNKTPHMKKVEKAASKLPALNQDATLTFNEIVANYDAAQVAALAAHLQHFNRVKATERALAQPLKQGMKVRVVAGDNRYVGLSGEVTKSQRIRCYVAIEGQSRPVYLFTSDVEVIAEEAKKSAVG